jgi:predicted transcriptional regulator
MPTTAQITDIVEKVRNRLAQAERDGIYLKISGERLDDEWLSIVVVPARPGVRASDHARLMSQIERELRQQGDDNVLLVPVLED